MPPENCKTRATGPGFWTNPQSRTNAHFCPHGRSRPGSSILKTENGPESKLRISDRRAALGIAAATGMKWSRRMFFSRENPEAIPIHQPPSGLDRKLRRGKNRQVRTSQPPAARDGATSQANVPLAGSPIAPRQAASPTAGRPVGRSQSPSRHREKPLAPGQQPSRRREGTLPPGRPLPAIGKGPWQVATPFPDSKPGSMHLHHRDFPAQDRRFTDLDPICGEKRARRRCKSATSQKSEVATPASSRLARAEAVRTDARRLLRRKIEVIHLQKPRRAAHCPAPGTITIQPRPNWSVTMP